MGQATGLIAVLSSRLFGPTRRVIDLVAALLLLVLLGPAMVIIGVLIRRGSPGPAVFRQERAGQHSGSFVCYKFRTMRSDVDPYGASPHSSDDPRITRVGRWLRETSLDELPQLFNVLKGEMSLVGPRPLYLRQAAEWNDRQRRRLEVKPGLTGLAQISGRAELTIEDKLELDVQYVEQAGFGMDTWILWRTLLMVLARRQGIYEKQYSRTADIETAALERRQKGSSQSP
jgi:lipopolysaccharide/colanic/teichoic acid biosynthesis glycosyltransferase